MLSKNGCLLFWRGADFRSAGDLKPQHVLLHGQDWHCKVRALGTVTVNSQRCVPSRRYVSPCRAPCRHHPCPAECPCALLYGCGGGAVWCVLRGWDGVLRGVGWVQVAGFGIRSLTSDRNVASRIETAQYMPPEALSRACMRACVPPTWALGMRVCASARARVTRQRAGGPCAPRCGGGSISSLHSVVCVCGCA